MKYNRILNEFYSTVWAIMPEKLDAIIEFLSLKSQGVEISFDESKSINSLHGEGGSSIGNTIVIPVYGVINQRMDLISQFSGGTSTERVANQIKSASNNPNIDNIVLDIDSPGGGVYGVLELSNIIFEARKKKKITAVANSLAASAAYWIGSSASEFVVTPSGEVGSIGVITAHIDQSKFDENIGIKTTIIKAGKFKDEGNPHEPLGKEAVAYIQSRVNNYYESFINGVARNRGIDKATVLSDFGQGRVFGADQALSNGMVDRIDTLDNVVNSFVVKSKKTRMNLLRAELDLQELA